MASWQYVYCILEGDRLPAGDYRGLEGAPVKAVAHREVSAVVSAVDRPRVIATRRQILAHERLVENLMERATVLPVRFGTVLSSPRSVRLQLSRDYASHLRDLELVRGKVELGVRVLATAEPPSPEGPLLQTPPTSGPGTRYLLGRLRESARARAARESLERWAGRIDARLMRQAEDRRVSPAAGDRTVMSASYLVWQQRVPAFKEEIQALREDLPDLQFLFTGPWPAYSFVGNTVQGVSPVAAIG